MTRKQFLAFGLAWAASMVAPALEAHAQRLLVAGIDISTSSAFTDAKSSQMINQAALRVHSLAIQMEPGDTIIIRTIGEYGPGTTREMIIRVTRQNPPARAAAIAAQLVAQVSGKITSGEWEQANATNILWFLQDAAAQADCTRNSVILLAYSDGLEHSDYATERQMLSGQASLPSFEAPFLEGCAIAMHGIGQRAEGTSLSTSEALVDTWKAFFAANGAPDALVTTSIPR